jgi:hypothetical protein
VKPAKRPVRRSRHGLVELSLIAAASNCGTSEITLRRKFGVHGIQPNENGKYLIRDLLTAFGPNGDSAKEKSLESHSRLQNHKARLTELEVLEAEKELVRRGPVMEFLKVMVQAIYRCVQTFDVEQKGRDTICQTICEIANEQTRKNGWTLLTLGDIEEIKRKYPHLRSEAELWSRMVCEGRAQELIEQ